MASNLMADQDFQSALLRAPERLEAVATPWTELSPAESLAHSETGPSDFDLDPLLRDGLPGRAATQPPLKPAAVLVPIILASGGTSVVFTQRATHLPAHAGQISFPGGKRDASDISPLATALREAQEEIGLAADLVQPLGRLAAYRTGTGYEVTPIIGLIQESFAPRLAHNEVSDIFEVPLSFLMEPGHHQIHAREQAGQTRRFYAIPYEDRFIWGATAGILVSMYKRLFKQ